MAQPLDFGRFEILPEARELRVEGRAVPLGGRAFDVLMALVQHRERLVTKAELMDLAWPGVVVEENNLQVQISALRKWLGAQVIVTVAGRGYKFAAGGGADSHGHDTSNAEPGARVAAAPAAHAGAPGATPARAHAARLLVADDNKVNRLLLTRSLQMLGHAVTAVEDGRKALELLEREPFDLLLLDLEMPELDGFGLLERRAASRELSEVPVIVTSSLEGVDKVARCIELGADDYLRKPVNPVLLKARVGSSLEKRRLRVQQRELIARLRAAAERAGPAAVEPVAAGDPVGSAARRAQAVVLAAHWAAAPEPAGAAAPPPAEDALELLDSCATLLREAVLGQGGLIFTEGGDTLLAVFGHAAGADASPAHSATRAALEMAEMIDALNAERAALGATCAALSVGVAGGEVLAGPAGLPLSPRFACVGEPVRRAAALAAHAASVEHTIVLDGPVQLALGPGVATEPLKPAAATGGAARPVHAVKRG